MSGYTDKRWVHMLQCRYSICFLMLSLTGYLYIFLIQTLRTVPLKELTGNFETNRSKRKTSSEYAQFEYHNNAFEAHSMEFDRKVKQTNTTKYNNEQAFQTYNVSIIVNKKIEESSSYKSTTKKNRKSKRLPQVLIIGVKKCGTRALLEYLRLHPDIKAPGPEPHFFDRNFHLGLDWYRERMPYTTKDQLTIEKTPRYFVNFDAPKRVWNMSRSMKLIVVVRNPVTRAISDFTQGATKRNYLHQSIFVRKAFRGNEAEDINTHWSIINTGLYIHHVQRWMEFFPLKQMFFVSGESLITNPAKELQGVQSFLGIKHVVTNENFYFNATKGFPCLLKFSRRPSSRCFNSSKGRKHLYLDELILKRLKQFYDPFNKKFYNLSGRNFGW